MCAMRFMEASYVQALPLQSSLITYSIFFFCSNTLCIQFPSRRTQGGSHLIPVEDEQNRVICMICACLVPPLRNFPYLFVKWLKVTRGSCQALCISLFPICWLAKCGTLFFPLSLCLSLFFLLLPTSALPKISSFVEAFVLSHDAGQFRVSLCECTSCLYSLSCFCLFPPPVLYGSVQVFYILSHHRGTWPGRV